MNADQLEAKQEQEIRERHAAYMAKLEAEFEAFQARIKVAHSKLDALGAPR